MEGSAGKTSRLVVFSQKSLCLPHFKGLLENQIERRFLHAFGRAGLGGAACGGLQLVVILERVRFAACLCKWCWLSEGGDRRETDRPKKMNESPGLCFISELLAGSFILIILRATMEKRSKPQL